MLQFLLQPPSLSSRFRRVAPGWHYSNPLRHPALPLSLFPRFLYVARSHPALYFLLRLIIVIYTSCLMLPGSLFLRHSLCSHLRLHLSPSLFAGARTLCMTSSIHPLSTFLLFSLHPAPCLLPALPFLISCSPIFSPHLHSSLLSLPSCSSFPFLSVPLLLLPSFLFTLYLLFTLPSSAFSSFDFPHIPLSPFLSVLSFPFTFIFNVV